MGCDVGLLADIEFFALLKEEDRQALADVVDSTNPKHRRHPFSGRGAG